MIATLLGSVSTAPSRAHYRVSCGSVNRPTKVAQGSASTVNTPSLTETSVVRVCAHGSSVAPSAIRFSVPRRILRAVGRPWGNGYCESCNGKLRDELLNVEIFDTPFEAQVLAERWRKHYNSVRPHSFLGYVPPAPEAAQAWLEG